MTLSAAQQTEVEKRVARVVYFAELEFASATLRLSTMLQKVSWGGYEWAGFGAIGSISAVEETGGLAPRALDFTLNIAQPSILALAVGPVEEYRGNLAKLYMCPLDEQFRMVGTPVRCWTGRMQTMSIQDEGKQGRIILNCETSAFDLKRASGLRLNAAQHKKKHPDDNGLDFQEDLKAKPSTWQSKRFLKR